MAVEIGPDEQRPDASAAGSGLRRVPRDAAELLPEDQCKTLRGPDRDCLH